MRRYYDFSNGRKNPYYDKLTKEFSVSVDEETLEYFKEIENDTGISISKLATLFLTDCARKKLRPNMSFN